MVGAGLGMARHPGRGLDVVKRSRAMAELIVKDEVNAAPRSSINVPIGAHRELAVVTVPIDDLKGIKNKLGGKLNDVVLAASAGGLRELLLSRGETPPEAGLRAMVPVNVRTDGEKLALGNKISSLFVELPVAEPDPLRRYQLQTSASRAPQAARPGDRLPGADRLQRPRAAGASTASSRARCTRRGCST